MDVVFFASERLFSFVSVGQPFWCLCVFTWVRSIVFAAVESVKSQAFPPPCGIACNMEYHFYALAKLSYL